MGSLGEPFKEAYARAFERALEQAIQDMPPRERAVLRLHFAEGMNIDEIGRVYAVHRATVARWIAAARQGLAGAVRARLEAQFGQLPSEEFDSLFRLVYEELDLSVTALLRHSALPSLVARDGVSVGSGRDGSGRDGSGRDGSGRAPSGRDVPGEGSSSRGLDE